MTGVRTRRLKARILAAADGVNVESVPSRRQSGCFNAQQQSGWRTPQ
jgi:hypothetical protein